MTDTEMADTVYIEPLTLEFVSRIIRKERPDALLANFWWSNRIEYGS